MPSIRTKFIAEGEKEYKEALKSIDNGMKVLQSESKSWRRSLRIMPIPPRR